MTTHWNNSTREGCGLAAAELFNVIMIYDERASAERGLALYQRLVAELGGDADFNLNVWKFAVLGLGRLDDISTEQAAVADLIIVCTRDEAEPAEQVKAWFQHWLDVKGQSDCALVVLGNAAQDSSTPTRRDGFFHALAQRGGLACFAQPPPVAAPRELMDRPGCPTDP